MAEQLPPELQQLAQELDELQERYIATVNQRVVIENELREIERILELLGEVGENARVYRGIGNIFFEQDREQLLSTLRERKETNELLLERFRKEEERLRSQIQELQEKLKSKVAQYYQRFTSPRRPSSKAS
uniref:Prefoldin subunit beta n=1 Tax=Fervidicoccus fontis TaxID=683846 RepID=A0A7J3ZN47_9CREN